MPPVSAPERSTTGSRFTPFRLMVLGAGLGLVASLAGASGAWAFSRLARPGPISEAYIVLADVVLSMTTFLGPIGAFLLLVGLARATRAKRAVMPPRDDSAPDAATSGPMGRERLVNPFRWAMAGAGLVLAAGLAEAVFGVLSLLLSPQGSGLADYLGYLQTRATVSLALTALYAAGTFVAFYGIAVSLRDGLGP